MLAAAVVVPSEPELTAAEAMEAPAAVEDARAAVRPVSPSATGICGPTVAAESLVPEPYAAAAI